MNKALNRRRFLAVCSVFVPTAWMPAKLLGGSTPGRQILLRTITYNVYGCDGYAETPEGEAALEEVRDQIPDRIAEELAKYRPHVVSFQEAPRQEAVSAIAKHLKMNYMVFPSGYKSSRPGSIGLPGALLSTFPIAAAKRPLPRPGALPDDLFTRHWGKATLSIEGTELTVISAHLHPSEAEVRMREVKAILAELTAEAEARMPVLFQGDLNHEPDTPEFQAWKTAALKDAGAAVKLPEGYTFKTPNPFKRIDYIWTSNNFPGRLTKCKVLNEGNFRLDARDRKSFALSDHLPVLAEYEL